VGTAERPAVPRILPLQVFKIGQFGLAIVPFETTTMSGHRIKKQVMGDFIESLEKLSEDPKKAYVELLSLSNAYVGYMTTYEEYQVQHYEGASTLFGPHQLENTVAELSRLTKELANNCKTSGSKVSCSTDSKAVPVFAYESLYGHPGGNSLLDSRKPPFWGSYGDLVQDVSVSNGKIEHGGYVSASFWCSAPANSQIIVKSFCDVEKYNQNSNKYETFLNDHDWNVRFLWRRKYLYFSSCSCEWFIENDLNFIPDGKYRLRLNGAYASKDAETPKFYSGISSSFQVISPGHNDMGTHHTHLEISKYFIYLFDEVLVFISITLLLLWKLIRSCCLKPTNGKAK